MVYHNLNFNIMAFTMSDFGERIGPSILNRF